MKTTFGAFVREKRLDKNIGLREFAIMMDLSPAYISQMEAGICKPPKEDKIQRIAEKLPISITFSRLWSPNKIKAMVFIATKPINV